MPVIKLRFGGYWIEISASDYSYTIFGDNCGLLIDTNESFWVLGMTAMRGYYITFDVSGNTIGFAPLSNSSKSKIQFDPSTSSIETPLTIT